MMWSPNASILAPHLHLHIYFGHSGRRSFLFNMTLKSLLWYFPEGWGLLISSRDVDICGHSMSSICDREGRSFRRVWLSSIFKREAASVWIRSLHLFLDDLSMKKLSLFSTFLITHRSLMS